MTDDLHTIFPLAAKYFYREYKDKGGSQKQFADDLGISKSYLSSIMSGSRSASVELQSRIANYLYGPYDKFLAVGRRLMEGKKPLEEDLPPQNDDNVESLIARLTYYIVDHKRLAESLEETKDFYKQIVENLPSGVFVTDKNDIINFINRFMVEHAGAPREKIIGVSMLMTGEEFSKGEFSEIQKQYLHAKQALKPLFFENVPVTTPAGVKVLQSGWMVPQVKDNKFNGMIIIISDTTRSQTLFNLLQISLDDSSDAVGIISQRSTMAEPDFFYINNKMRKIYGQDEEKHKHISVHESLEITSNCMKNGAAFLEFVQENITSGRKSAKFIAEHKDGKQFEWSSSAMHDESGRYCGRIAKAKELKKKRKKG